MIWDCYDCVTGNCGHAACRRGPELARPAVTLNGGTAQCADCAIRKDRRNMGHRRGGLTPGELREREMRRAS